MAGIASEREPFPKAHSRFLIVSALVLYMKDHHKFCLMLVHLSGFSKWRKKAKASHLQEAMSHFINSMRAKLRDLDIVGRVNSDTLAAILPDVNGSTGKLIAGRILKDISSFKFSGKKGDNPKPSIGIAEYPKDASFKNDLIEASEIALEAALKNKKPSVKTYSN